MSKSTATAALPRSLTGGYSDRYEERHAERGAQNRYGPEWTVAAASRLHVALKADAQKQGLGLYLNTLLILLSEARQRALITAWARNRGLSKPDAQLVGLQLAHYGQRAQQACTGMDPEAIHVDAAAKKVLHSLFKVLRERSKQMAAVVAPLVVEPVTFGPRSFHGWLSPRPGEDRHRSTERCHRISNGLSQWCPRWFPEPVVVCYERLHERVQSERLAHGGPVGPLFTSGLVHSRRLPTLTGAPGNQYIVVMPGGAWRFMTVAEVARAFMLAFGSPLWQALVESDALKPLQAVERMGRGIHVGVAQAIVAMLVAEGSLQPGATYASAYSGIDMFAAAVDAELEGEWRYSFASEPDVLSRRVLLQAWGQRGLRAERCYLDACSAEARQEASVDLWVSSPECTSHSPANRGDEGNVSAAQAASLAAIWQSLDYVRRARPRAVVLENVAQRSISGPLTGLLSRLGGYSVRTGVLDPQSAADAPIARERQFWVLTAVAAEQSG